MKPAALLLVGSLALNAVFLAGLVFRRSDAITLSNTRAAVATAISAHPPSPALAETSKLAPGALRESLQQTNLPAEVVDALVLARIFSRYESRRREFFAETLKLPWWRSALIVTTGTRQSLFTPAQRKELRDLEASARDEALRVLGPHALDPDGSIALRHAFLAPEKAVLLDALLRDYENLGATLKEETGGLRTAADRERERFLETERRRDLAALLTPEELERFELRTSPIAQRLQWRLGGFEPTEVEYRAVLTVHKVFEQQNPGPVSLEGHARRYDFSEVPEFNQQIREALGEARFADWKLTGQAHYIALDRLAPQLGLSPETVRHVGVLLGNTAARSREIGESMAMTPSEKKTALAELAASTRAEVGERLGMAGAEKYLRESVSWLELIAKGNAVEPRESGGVSYRSVDRPARPAPRPAAISTPPPPRN